MPELLYPTGFGAGFGFGFGFGFGAGGCTTMMRLAGTAPPGGGTTTCTGELGFFATTVTFLVTVGGADVVVVTACVTAGSNGATVTL